MFFVPSLQHMAYSTIAVALCNQTDMKAPFNELKTFHIDPYPKGLSDIIFGIVERAKQKINVLRIAEKLKPDLIIVLKSTVLQIFKWFRDHSDILEPDFDDRSSFYWKSKGTIGRVKTAEALAGREEAPLAMRLKFAMCYCLDKDALGLQTMAAMRMRLKFANWIYLEEDVLRLQRRCLPRMLLIRAELRYLNCTDWMRDWRKRLCLPRMDEKDLEVVFASRYAAETFLGLAALQLSSTHGELTAEIYVETGLGVLTWVTGHS
ncbi:hypothetical protein CDAR_103371 [Caerostris darwini]|uniref:Uncharacterized protein n=1 Tax=Caerostris darwini TaxID=1538125 RepID=A0AAV4NBC6_9ARAC|nr:hypothetical protein CDAR_103371 [Caerostris darwini]